MLEDGEVLCSQLRMLMCDYSGHAGACSSCVCGLNEVHLTTAFRQHVRRRRDDG